MISRNKREGKYLIRLSNNESTVKHPVEVKQITHRNVVSPTSIFTAVNNWSPYEYSSRTHGSWSKTGTVYGAQSNDYEPSDADDRRWFILSNGERIYDAVGHLYTWVFDDVQGDENGLIAKPFSASSISLTTAPHPSMEKGVGWHPKADSNWSGRALLRGGYWDSGGYVGFRCIR